MGSHENNKKLFAGALLVIQIIVIIMYGIFVRPKIHSNPAQNGQYYPMYQDINVMMLIGFGFLMTFIKSHSWSALSYTFFINSIVVQLYILFQPFWHKVFHGHWENQIQIVEKSFTSASYSVASVLIAFGAVLGRVGPLELLIMAVIQIIGYTLNEAIVYEVVKVFDAGGSTAIHTFGAYFGLTVSFIIGKMVPVKTKAQSSYNSNIFAMIGCLFLWMFWPSFNAGYFSTSPYEKSVIIINTIISLTGSCLGTFITTALIRQKFEMEDILNASLAGGVIIGAPSGLFTNPAASLCIGLFGGIISTFCFKNLGPKLQKMIGLQDTCGVHNLHGLPGVLGGIFSAIAVASYTSQPLNNATQLSGLPFYLLCTTTRTFYQQGGIQIAGIFISMGIAIVFGIVAGFLIRVVYIFQPADFFKDEIYFQLPHQSDEKPNYLQTIPLSNSLDNIHGNNHGKIHAEQIKI